MSEFSGLWTTGGAGDGSSTYTRQNVTDFFKVLAACHGFEGVAPSYLNTFNGSIPGANTFRVATGGALVDGKTYYNDANVDVNIPSAVGGGNTRIDRIVLRAGWAAQTVRITRIAGTDAASPTPPAITQTPSTTYDIMLYQVRVNTSGTVTIELDERVLATIAAASITNRTRQFLVMPLKPTSPGGGATVYTGQGAVCANSVATGFNGYFLVPKDFASGMTVKAVVSPALGGDVYGFVSATYGANGEAYNTHSGGGVAAAAAVVQNIIAEIFSISLASAAIGDYVALAFQRDATHASDTVNDNVYLFGFLVEYTADS